MIEMLSDLPEGVTGIRVSGRLTAEDFIAIRPAVSTIFNAGREVRWVEVIDDFRGFGKGALREDVKLGLCTVLPRFRALRRTAIVADVDWLRRAMRVLAWMVPGEVAVFELHEIDSAARWAAGWT